MTAVLQAQGLGKSYGRRWALTRLHAGHPGRARRRAGRPQRGRQDHAAEPGRRHAHADRGHDRGARRPPRGRPGAAGQGRLRRPGHPHLRRAERRRPPAARRPAQPRLGRRAGAAAGSSGSASTRRSGPGKLSGGQRAQLALTLGVAKRPELLILDEPVASLDPLARREFLQDLMEAVAEHELSVVLSSHLVSDLERVCDYLIVLVASRVQRRRRRRHAAGHPPPAHRRRAATRPGSRPTSTSSPRATPTGRPRCSSAPTRRSTTPPGRSASSAWRTSSSPTWASRRRTATAGPRWRPSDDLADLAPVPRPGRADGRRASPSSPSSSALTGPGLADDYADRDRGLQRRDDAARASSEQFFQRPPEPRSWP